MSHQLSTADEGCPVHEELLGELYSASKLGLPLLVATVPPDTRAMLALFCYRRSHLHELGLAIAASCDEDGLVRWGARLGEVLFARSRGAPQSLPIASKDPHRRKITLATGLLRKMPPIDDGSDEEIGEPARQSIDFVPEATIQPTLHISAGKFTGESAVDKSSYS
jgi:hypothetical protein